MMQPLGLWLGHRSQGIPENQHEQAMVKRTSHKDAGCALARPLDAIGDGWSLLIVRDAFEGLRRFGEFQRSLGLARNILSARLRSLVDHGILQAVAAADGGAHHEYVLTDKGRGLFPLTVALRQWGEEHFFENDRPRATLVDRRTGQAVRRLEIRAQDGRSLSAEDTMTQLRDPPPLPPAPSPSSISVDGFARNQFACMAPGQEKST